MFWEEKGARAEISQATAIKAYHQPRQVFGDLLGNRGEEREESSVWAVRDIVSRWDYDINDFISVGVEEAV